MRDNHTTDSSSSATEQFPTAATALIAKRMLVRHKPREIAEAIEVLVDLLDLMGGDPDSEDDDPDEVQGDEQDAAWIEWHTMRGSMKRGPNVLAGHEDAEDDDPSGVHDEDGINTLMGNMSFLGDTGPGCPISDPGGCEHDGREEEDGI